MARQYGQFQNRLMKVRSINFRFSFYFVLFSSALLSFSVTDPRETLQAADWPQFRGPEGSGISESGAPPVEFGPNRNVIWKTPLPPGHSSPVLTEDHIFVTAFEDEKLLTIALDRESGRILWRREAPHPRRESFQRTHGPASPTPVTDGENVYAFFGDFGLLSYGPDGGERWRLPLGPFNNANGHGSSPILADGLLILLCDQDSDSYVIAVDQATGKVRWKTDRPEVSRSYATPGVFRPADGPAELIVPGTYVVVSYDLQSGEKLWWVTGMAWQLKSVPLFDGNMIYINAWEIGGDPGQEKDPPPPFEEILKQHDANNNGVLDRAEAPYARLKKDHPWSEADFDKDGVLDDGDWRLYIAWSTAINNFVAIRHDGRRGDLTRTNVLWRYRKSLPNTPSPLLYRNVLWLVKDGGIVTTLDPRDGRAIKQGRLRNAIDKYWASPVGANGAVYMTSESCKVSVLEPEGQWKVRVTNSFDDQCFATPAIADGKIYFRTLSTLYCLGENR